MVELRRKTARSWLVDYPRAVPLVIFLLIASITAMSLFSIERGESERDRARIQAVSQSIAAALEQRGSTSSAFLRAGAALFGTVDYVDEPLFRRFVDELRFDEEYRGASGIGWAEAVRPDQLAEYRQRIGSDDPGRNGIFPPYDGSSKWIAPVTYLEPRTAGNRAPHGDGARGAGTQAYRQRACHPAVADGQRTDGRIRDLYARFRPGSDCKQHGRSGFEGLHLQPIQCAGVSGCSGGIGKPRAKRSPPV
jgi:hypothetical protein